MADDVAAPMLDAAAASQMLLLHLLGQRAKSTTSRAALGSFIQRALSGKYARSIDLSSRGRIMRFRPRFAHSNMLSFERSFVPTNMRLSTSRPLLSITLHDDITPKRWFPKSLQRFKESSSGGKTVLLTLLV